MTDPSLHAPWREPRGAVLARHVGRERVLSALHQAALAFASGGQPLPMYLFGPRGIGKSHLLTIAAEGLREELALSKVPLVIVPEDIPALRSADELLARTMPDVGFGGDTPHPGRDRWRRWGRGQVTAPAYENAPRRVVFLEGLDRQLVALGARERKHLRQLLDRGAGTWIVGTGVALGREMTRTTEAFYGAFDPWPLEPLEEAEALTLLDRISMPPDTPEAPAWEARRATLALLAGGIPRALVALGNACRREPAALASEQLHGVLGELTAYYQLRFRGLSPNSQRLVELLAEAPHELAPTELAAELGCSVAQISVQAGRLVDDGVLRHRSEGRQSWYRLAEPLFRFWLEYRNADWRDTRIGWLSRLLEEAGSRGVAPRLDADEAALLAEQLVGGHGARLHTELDALQHALGREVPGG